MELSSSLKGGIAEADAIGYYTKLGYTVSIPFAPAGYDIVIEQDGAFVRVQCKYTGHKDLNYYSIGLLGKRRDGTRFSRCGYDVLFCLTEQMERYIFTAAEVNGKRRVRLTEGHHVTHDLPEPVIGHAVTAKRCQRCHRHYDGSYAVCDTCRPKVAETQRKYRARKRSLSIA